MIGPVVIRAAGLVATLALLAAGGRALAQQADHDEISPQVRSIVVVDGQVVKDAATPATASGLTVDARVETDAEGVRRDAVDLLNDGGTGTRPLDVAADTKTVVEARGVVSETATKRAKACVQIGVIGAQAECRPK